MGNKEGNLILPLSNEKVIHLHWFSCSCLKERMFYVWK